MPKNVRRFAWLWNFSWLISYAEIFLVPIHPDELRVSPFIILLLSTIFVAVIVAIQLPFLWLAVWRGKNWARWVLFFVFIAMLPMMMLDSTGPAVFLDLTRLNSDQMRILGVDILAAIVGAAGFFFVFTGNAKLWFQRKI